MCNDVCNNDKLGIILSINYCSLVSCLYFSCFRDNDWWLARNLSNLGEGYIPKNHVALATSLECQE